MARTDPDLAAVRAAASEIAGRSAEPSPDTVARVWSRVAVSLERPSPGRRLRWLAAPVGAAAVAAVLLATALLRPSPGTPVGSSPSQSPAVPSSAMPPAGEPTVRVTDFGTTGSPVPVRQVIDELAARSASVVPLDPADGQVLYLRIEAADVRNDGSVDMRLNEQWLDPNGLRVLNIVLDLPDLSSPSPRDGSATRRRHPVRPA